MTYARHASPAPRRRRMLVAPIVALAAVALIGGGVAVNAATTVPSKADGLAAINAARASLDIAAAALAVPDPTVTVTETIPGPTVTTTATATATVTATPTPTPSTSSPTPTPTATVPVGGQPVIPFAPPVLASPIVLDATKTVNTGFKLDPARDYIIKLPSGTAYKNTVGLSISGGHNVVIIGGVIDVGNGSGGARRCGYFKDITGTLHIEGVRCGSSTSTLTEGIDIAAGQATIQIANVHLSSLAEGTYATNHADLIQTWNGPKSLRIFGFKGKSTYQGMFLDSMKFGTTPPADGSWTMDRIDVEAGAYTLWLIPPPGSVVLGPQVHAYGGKGLWKPAMWPGVKTYVPVEDFVPSAGLAYVSPGYL